MPKLERRWIDVRGIQPGRLRGPVVMKSCTCGPYSPAATVTRPAYTTAPLISRHLYSITIFANAGDVQLGALPFDPVTFQAQ